MHPHDPLAFKRRSNNGGGRLERLLPGTDPDGFNGVAGGTLVQTAHNGFDFGEFGHAVRIQGRDNRGRVVMGLRAVQTGRTPTSHTRLPRISGLPLHSPIRYAREYTPRT